MPRVRFVKRGIEFASECTNTVLPRVPDSTFSRTGSCFACVTPVDGRDDCSTSLFTPWGGGTIATFKMSGAESFVINGIQTIADYASETNTTAVDVWAWDEDVQPVDDDDINDLEFAGLGGLTTGSAASCYRCGGANSSVSVALTGSFFESLRIDKTVTVCYEVASNQVRKITVVLGMSATLVHANFAQNVEWVAATARYSGNVPANSNPLTVRDGNVETFHKFDAIGLKEFGWLESEVCERQRLAMWSY